MGDIGINNEEEWPVLDGSTGFGLVLLTVNFFFCLNCVCSFFPVPKNIVIKAKTDPFRLYRWRNLVISNVHAAITGCWAVFCLWYFSDMWMDMLAFKNWPCFCVCCFSTGYFIYDTLDIIYAKRIVEKWEILVHHTAIVSSALYSVINVTAIGYHVLSMSIEFNTTFLHFRKILQLAAFTRDSAVLQTNRYLNLVTFIIFRFGPLFLLVRALYVDAHRVHRWFAVQFSVSMFVLIGVNVILFSRLVKADVKHLFVKDTPAPSRGLGHKKIDSMAGICGSMQVAEDLRSKNASQYDLAAMTNGCAARLTSGTGKEE